MAGIKVKVGADASQFERTMKGVKGRLSSLNVMVAGMVAFKALGASIRAAGDAMRGFMDLVKQGEQAKTEEARLRNVIRQMGLYGASADQVTDKLIEQANAAELLTGVDRASITMTQSKLATFAELAKTAGVVGGAFDRTTAAAIDLAATGFGSAESNAVMLGKALADPERGLTALRRTGTLTTAQIDKIKEAFEQSGNRAEYMANVLDAVERQVKGTAEATANGTVRMQKGFAQLREEIGKPLSDQFDKLADLLMAQVPKLKEAASTIGKAISDSISDAIEGDTAKIASIGKFVGELLGESAQLGFRSAFKLGFLKFREEFVNVFYEGTPLGAGLKALGMGKGNEALAQKERSEITTDLSKNFDQLIADTSSKYAAMMAQLQYDPNFKMKLPDGTSMVQAPPGMQTVFRDAEGRRLIEEERMIEMKIEELSNAILKLERSIKPSTFPNQ
jgi:hypothetical protein